MSQDEAPKTVADALSAVQRMQAQAAELLELRSTLAAERQASQVRRCPPPPLLLPSLLVRSLRQIPLPSPSPSPLPFPSRRPTRGSRASSASRRARRRRDHRLARWRER